MHNRLLDYRPVMELADAPWQPGEDSEDSQDSEDNEMALGAQLLEVRDRRALARWLSGLTRGAARPGTPLGDALATALTQAAQAVLPLRGPASHLKQRAAAIFGLELEGLSPEDMEFEVARHFVRFATDAAGRLDAGAGRMANAANEVDAASRVRAAIGHAARRHAPGLAPAGLELPKTQTAGRWRRVGGRIVVDC